MGSVKNYKCPSCGGGLSFDASSGKVTCPYCESSFDVKEIEELYSSKEDEESTGNGTGEQIANESTVESGTFDSMDSQWNTDSLNENWGTDADEMRQYSCPSCGASIICEKSTAATSCPYCDNPMVMQQQFSGSLKPDYIIPFKVKKDAAISALKNFYKDKPLLPDEFENQNHMEEIKGVYVPFWFFDGTAYGKATFHTTTTHTSSNANGTVIQTRNYKCRREGEIRFRMVPVDASKKMDNALMDSIEPYDYSEIKEFSTGYLPGYLANIHDDKVENCFVRANTRCVATCIEALENTVTGYESVRLTSKQVNLKQGNVHYGLLPVWLLNTKCDEKKYVYAINGQTGKVVGELPISSSKSVKRFIRRFLVTGLICGAIAVAFMYFMGGF